MFEGQNRDALIEDHQFNYIDPMLELKNSSNIQYHIPADAIFSHAVSIKGCEIY